MESLAERVGEQLIQEAITLAWFDIAIGVALLVAVVVGWRFRRLLPNDEEAPVIAAVIALLVALIGVCAVLSGVSDLCAPALAAASRITG